MTAVVLFAAGFGAIVGSFLNVVVHRLPHGEPLGLFRKSRSSCPSCGTGIRWYDNVPIVSWLVLRGHCRACGWRIPLRYPLVEGTTALLFGVAAWRALDVGWTPALGMIVAAAVFSALLVASAAIAVLHGRVPGRLLLTGGLLGLAACVALEDLPRSDFGVELRETLRPAAEAMLNAAGGAAGAAFVLLILGLFYRFALRREVLRPGDAALGGMAGTWLGPQYAFLGLAAGLMLAAVGGALVLLLARRRVRTMTPFFAAGFWVVLLWGAPLRRLAFGA